MVGKKTCCSFLLFCHAYFGSSAFCHGKDKTPITRDFSVGCLGCFPEPTLVKGQAMNKDNRSEDFWSSSALEIDQSALQSQKSISSIGIPSDPQSSAGIQIDSPEYVNHGLLLWNQMRQQWIGNRRPENKKQVGEPKISWNATYESLMGSNKTFPRPIPLGEMVEFLVDIWELEGLYD